MPKWVLYKRRPLYIICESQKRPRAIRVSLYSRPMSRDLEAACSWPLPGVYVRARIISRCPRLYENVDTAAARRLENKKNALLLLFYSFASEINVIVQYNIMDILCILSDCFCISPSPPPPPFFLPTTLSHSSSSSLRYAFRVECFRFIFYFCFVVVDVKSLGPPAGRLLVCSVCARAR